MSTMRLVYFKSEDDGDGTYDGQIGHAYLDLDDGSTGTRGATSASSPSPRPRRSLPNTTRS
jgi:hypothetical protein